MKLNLFSRLLYFESNIYFPVELERNQVGVDLKIVVHGLHRVRENVRVVENHVVN